MKREFDLHNNGDGSLSPPVVKDVRWPRDRRRERRKGGGTEGQTGDK